MIARDQPVQDPIQSVFRRTASATRRTDHRTIADPAENQEIAWVYRHANAFDRTACQTYGFRNYVVIGDNGGSPKEDNHVVAGQAGSRLYCQCRGGDDG